MTTLDALFLFPRSTSLDRVSIGRPPLAERTADVVFEGPAIHAPVCPAFGPIAASASSRNSGEPGSCDREVPS